MSTKKKPQKTKKTLEKEEIKSLVDMFAELMNAYGRFSESLGKIQEAHEEAYENIFSLEALQKLPEMLNKIIEEKPPELSQLVIKVFSKMTAFLPQVSRIMDLSAEDKIRLGENLKSLAKDFRKLQKWVEKEKKE